MTTSDNDRLLPGDRSRSSHAVPGMTEIDAIRQLLATTERDRAALETLLQQLSRYMPIVMWVADENRNLTFVSDRWFEMSGQQPDEIANWAEAIMPEDREHVVAHILAASNARQPVSIEYRSKCANGGYDWVLNLASPRYDASGAYAGYVGVLVDISERRAAEDARRAAEARLTSALEGTGVGVWEWDVASGSVWLSDTALAIQGFRRGDVETSVKDFPDYIHPDDFHSFRRQLTKCLKGDIDLLQSENRLRRKDGGWVWVHERARVVERDGSGRALRMIGTRSDMTERRAQEERIRWLATHDTLTGVLNRVSFSERLQDAIAYAADSGSGLGVLMLDLDRFKAVNDQHGHDAGDAMLRVAADALGQLFPPPASVARFGGDEFAVLVPRISDPSALADMAERAVLAEIIGATDGRTTTASVGGALYPDHGRDAAAIMKQADLALFRAKARGRACAVISSRSAETG